MGKSKLQIPKVCKYCGNTFLAKTVKTGYCSHQCASSASNDRKKMERRQKVLDKIKAAGTEYITITEALKIFTTSRLTVIRLVHSKNIRCFKTSPKRWFVCVKDLEALFPLRSKPIVVETPVRCAVCGCARLHGTGVSRGELHDEAHWRHIAGGLSGISIQEVADGEPEDVRARLVYDTVVLRVRVCAVEKWSNSGDWKSRG